MVEQTERGVAGEGTVAKPFADAAAQVYFLARI